MAIKEEDIIQDKMSQGIKYLHGVPDEQLSSPDYIPEHIRSVLTPWVRDVRRKHDELTDIMDSVDKASPEYEDAARGREQLANSLVKAKDQIGKHNKGTMEMKQAVASMSKGTQNANLYTNTVIFGAQSDAIGFDDSGKMSFGSVTGVGEDTATTFLFDDHASPLAGETPIITEPVGSKGYVWKLAEKTKQDATSGKKFDEQWTYTSIFNNLTESGPQNSIGMAFADLAGDNQTKSFAQQYESGLSDPSYYVNPETGEQLPPDSGWMKDPAQGDMLKKFLGKYITSIMKDVHGPTIDEETGLIKKSQSQLAQELIKKYKHPGHEKH